MRYSAVYFGDKDQVWRKIDTVADSFDDAIQIFMWHPHELEFQESDGEDVRVYLDSTTGTLVTVIRYG